MKRLIVGISGMLVFTASSAIEASNSAADYCPMIGSKSRDVHDYHDAQEGTLRGLVDGAHFTPEVEQLIRGHSTTLPGPDITYTLDVFPNHQRALDAASRLSIKTKSSRPPGLRCHVEGYFRRAIEFKPADGEVRAAYGMHLYRTKNIEKALEQFEQAEKLAPDDSNLAYNIGLVYFDLKKYDKAMAYAEKAYQGNFPLQGLKQKLTKVGKWVEPKPLPAEQEPKPEQPKAPEPESAESKQ